MKARTHVSLWCVIVAALIFGSCKPVTRTETSPSAAATAVTSAAAVGEPALPAGTLYEDIDGRFALTLPAGFALDQAETGGNAFLSVATFADDAGRQIKVLFFEWIDAEVSAFALLGLAEAMAPDPGANRRTWVMPLVNAMFGSPSAGPIAIKRSETGDQIRIEGEYAEQGEVLTAVVDQRDDSLAVFVVSSTGGTSDLAGINALFDEVFSTLTWPDRSPNE